MLLAQGPNQAHANSLYHEWGLLSSILGLCALIFGGLWWLLCLDSRGTTADALKVRSVLAGMFQQTIVEGAVAIFDLIDNHLPYALSQVDNPNARPSVFDRLCERLKEFGAVEKNRDGLREVLEDNLSGVVINEVRKLLRLAEEIAPGEPSTHPNPTGLRISLEGDTERRLGFIAQKTVTSNKMERDVRRSRWCAFASFACAIASGLFVSPWTFIDAEWAFSVTVAFLALFSGAVILGLAFLLWFYRCRNWLEDKAARYPTPRDWFGELSQHRVR
ncbi:MAG: hypothetical protein IID44_26105 [Planctomycetes bacterium]|nr:hypothetical protein [Planctomycetota bacterium]